MSRPQLGILVQRTIGVSSAACLLVATVSCSAGLTPHGGDRALTEQSFAFVPIPLGDKNSVSCRAISSLYVGQGIAGIDAEQLVQNRLSARVSKGTDTIAIQIEREFLVFLTRASLEAGVAEGSRFPIVENGEHYLRASESVISGSATLESFVLNKHNGLAIWTRIRPLGFFGNLAQAAPDSETIYLACV